ncbi:MAG TPA: DMT family transporter [Oculatellaceae cyanobacterium]
MTKTENNAPLLGGAAILIGSQLAIGAAAIFAKFALLGAGAVAVSALRLTIAAAIAIALSARTKPATKMPLPHECLLAFCGLASAVHFSSWIASLNLTSVAASTLLVSTAPVWTTLYDLLFLGRRPSMQFWIGFLAIALGAVVAVMCGATETVVRTGAQQQMGAILSLLGGFAFACYLIAVRTISYDYATLVIVNRTYTWSAIFLWGGVFLLHEKLPAADPTCWAGILGMSIFSQLLGHTGMNLSLKTFSSSVVALSTLLEPGLAAILALLVFHEALSVATLLGGLLIVAGLGAVMAAKVDEYPVSTEAQPMSGMFSTLEND